MRLFSSTFARWIGLLVGNCGQQGTCHGRVGATAVGEKLLNLTKNESEINMVIEYAVV